MELPTSYLGLPRGAPHKSCGVCDVIEEIQEEICCLEETILVKRRKTNPY